MYVILQLQHSVGDVSNSTSSTVQSLTELVVYFYIDTHTQTHTHSSLTSETKNKKQQKEQRQFISPYSVCVRLILPLKSYYISLIA